MKALVALCISSLLAFPALAHDDHDGGNTTVTAPHKGDHTGEFCTDDSQTICAHLHFLADVNTTTEGSFIAHIETPDNQPINNFKIDMWMQMGSHGHGSAPFEVADNGQNHYTITNAWFVMPGTWTVRIDFDFNGAHQHIEIPVTAAQ